MSLLKTTSEPPMLPDSKKAWHLSSFSQFGTMGSPDLVSSSNMHTLTFQILIVKTWEKFLIWALQPVFQPVALWRSLCAGEGLRGHPHWFYWTECAQILWIARKWTFEFWKINCIENMYGVPEIHWCNFFHQQSSFNFPIDLAWRSSPTSYMFSC